MLTALKYGILGSYIVYVPFIFFQMIKYWIEGSLDVFFGYELGFLPVGIAVVTVLGGVSGLTVYAFFRLLELVGVAPDKTSQNGRLISFVTALITISVVAFNSPNF